MIKVLARSIREYKKSAILTPLLVIVEVVLECIIPFVIANLVNEMQAGCSMEVIVNYGIQLVVMAILSLAFGVAAGTPAPRLPPALRATCARICSIVFRIIPLRILINSQFPAWLPV
ncbi:Uncharacterised protein [uncultured Ruminococcus sp.]|nr:Uncharacterised protein [uncultured Ruminococcus sp.]